MRELRQLPLETTLMGAACGAAEFYGLELSPPMLYGGTGHAFVINIHPRLCPSGPYCWNPRGLEELLPNLGLRRRTLGFFGPKSEPEDRGEVEERIRDLMDSGVPCSLLNMDNQLIAGFDDRGFHLAQPWPGVDFPPARLSFGSWEELKEVHLSFYAWDREEPASFEKAFLASLDMALELFDRPRRYAEDGYRMGMEAWKAWIEAVEKGFGDTHGSWWNARVWGECRLMAGRYLAETELRLEGNHGLVELAGDYTFLGTGMLMAADRKMPAAEKTSLLKELRGLEDRCVQGLRKLRERLR